MRNKMMTLVSLLALTLSAPASAQVITTLPGGRGGLSSAVPVAVPAPIYNLSDLVLPAPRLTPSAALTLSAPSLGDAMPILPIAGIMPIGPIQGVMPVMPAPKFNPTLPGAGIMPIAPIRYAALSFAFSAPAKDGSPAETPRSREKLDKVFDGRKQPADKGAVDAASPVRSDRHHSLPENDLEKEIGAY